MPDNIENKKEFTNRQLIMMVAFAVSATFTLTTIYNRFLFAESHMQTIEKRIEKIKDRQTQTDQEQNERLKALEEHGTDKDPEK